VTNYEAIYAKASRENAPGIGRDNFPAGIAAVVAAAKAEALKGELTEFRKRVQQAFEWPNPELAMDVLGQIQFLMISERFPITCADKRAEIKGEQQ